MCFRRFQVDGRLPLLGIDFTDKVLEALCDIIAHVPLPEADPSQRIPTDPDALLKVCTCIPPYLRDSPSFLFLVNLTHLHRDDTMMYLRLPSRFIQV